MCSPASGSTPTALFLDTFGNPKVFLLLLESDSYPTHPLAKYSALAILPIKVTAGQQQKAPVVPPMTLAALKTNALCRAAVAEGTYLELAALATTGRQPHL
jgi:hypothetical protein